MRAAFSAGFPPPDASLASQSAESADFLQRHLFGLDHQLDRRVQVRTLCRIQSFLALCRARRFRHDLHEVVKAEPGRDLPIKEPVSAMADRCGCSLYGRDTLRACKGNHRRSRV
jgi:hypothetical protein